MSDTSLLTPSLPAQKPRNIGVTLIALGAAVALLYFGRLFFITLVVAIIIAFLLDPFVSFLVRLRLPRSLASFLVCSVTLLLIYLLGLGLYAQLSVLAEDLPRYSERLNQLVDNIAQKLEETEQTAYQLLVPKRFQPKEPPPAQAPAQPAARIRRSAEPPTPITPPAVQEVRIQRERTSLVNYVYSYLRSFYYALLMASFVPFLVYFMLSWRDHIRKSFLNLFQVEDRPAVGKSYEGIAGMVRAYVVGNFVLGVLLAAVSGLFFWAMKLPYFLLIGPLSGFLSLIPYIGLPLAILPPFVASLLVFTSLTPFLVIAAVVGFLHLLALNLFYPAMVGSRVHLNPLAVTVALMFFGILWGGVGLVLAIPVAAGLKAACDNIAGLKPYGRLLGD